MSAEDDLLMIVPPLDDGLSSAVEWDAFEEQFGQRLPGDYKWLVDAYGPGKFDDFLYVLQPHAESRYVRLEYSRDREREILVPLEEGNRMPYSVNELLPVVKSDNGDTIFWVARQPDDPGLWRITGHEARGIAWPSYDGGIVEFLVAVLSGARRFEIFPRDFPSDSPSFSRYRPRRPRRFLESCMDRYASGISSPRASLSASLSASGIRNRPAISRTALAASATAIPAAVT
jgi:hypothetical protein